MLFTIVPTLQIARISMTNQTTRPIDWNVCHHRDRLWTAGEFAQLFQRAVLR